MLNLNSVMIGTKQPKVLAAFYEKVLGQPAGMVDEENGFFGWQAGAAYLSVLDHSEDPDGNYFQLVSPMG
jgi:hypothetical protein